MDIVSKLTNEELLEDYRLFSIACEENPDDVGSDSHLYNLQQELLKRMTYDR